MKSFIGVLLIITGLFLGLYVGLYLCLYGGFLQIVNGLQAYPISGSAIAMGVVRVMCAVFAGVISAFALMLPGLAIVESFAKRKGWW